MSVGTHELMEEKMEDGKTLWYCKCGVVCDCDGMSRRRAAERFRKHLTALPANSERRHFDFEPA